MKNMMTEKIDKNLALCRILLYNVKASKFAKKSLGGNFLMMQREIFKGLQLTETVARDLAIYHRVAGGVIGVIDANGYLITPKGTWLRPRAHGHFKELKEALDGAELAIICNNYIVVDFPMLTYNLEWIKEIIKKENLGVQDSPEGLLLFQKKKTENTLWYNQVYWTLKGVTTGELGLELKKEVVSLSSNQENPDDAEWAKLYFAVA
ncbi:MAG: hypothetical protein ACI4VP_01805 [Clostridia bacterium]